MRFRSSGFSGLRSSAFTQVWATWPRSFLSSIHSISGQSLATASSIAFHPQDPNNLAYRGDAACVECKLCVYGACAVRAFQLVCRLRPWPFGRSTPSIRC